MLEIRDIMSGLISKATSSSDELRTKVYSYFEVTLKSQIALINSFVNLSASSIANRNFEQMR